MKKTSYILALLTAASALLLSGCAKEMDVNGDGAALRFSTNSLEIVSTKAAGEALTGTAAATNRTMNLYSDGKLSDMTLEVEESVNTDGLAAATKAAEITGNLTTFTVAGFDGTERWFPKMGPEQEVDTHTSYVLYKWNSSKNYKFFGYANLPASSSVASAAIANNGVTLTYTAVPESATDQNDILLGASYENVPAEGKANMTFYHPLAEVVFKLESSSFSGTSVKVTGITLDGVYKSGTVVCDGNENPNKEGDYFKFTWTYTGSKGTVSQTNASGISISSGVIGVPFMLIPQAFTSGASLTVNVDLEIGDAAKSFTATLDDIIWNSGKKYTYTIKRKSGPDPEFWVDLGMVSENGYPLYISKYNVDRIEGGVAYFTDSETDTGLNQFLGSASYTSEDGQPCRTLEISDFWGITSASNTEIESTSNGFLVTSKITGKAVNFPFSDDNCVYCTAFPPFSDFHETAKTYLTRAKDVKSEFAWDWSTLTEMVSKLVCEDINAKKINLNDFKLYYPQNAIAPNWTDYTVSKFIEISNNGTSTWLCQYSIGIMSISCSNGYTLYTSKHVSNYLWTGEKVIDNDWIIIGQEVCSGNNSYVTVTHGSQSLKYLVQNMPSCYPKGTLITLADGSRKPVEEISYNDELKVWNFDKGCYDSAKPFWITKAGLRNNCYYKCTFSDGKILNILGLGYTGHQTGHKMYNYTDHFFEGVKTIEVGKEIFTEDGIVTLIGKEEVYEDVEYYCLMTKNHLNCFANGVLTSLRYNNIYPIDDDMKFVKDNRKKRPYKEFKSVGISREWYNDLRLGEQTDSLDIIKEFVDRYDAQTREKPAPTFWQKFRTWWKSIFG